MVPPLRLGELKESLKEPVQMGGRPQVLAARHEIDALVRIVHHHAEVIGHSRVLSTQNHVSHLLRSAGLLDAPLHKAKRSGSAHRLRQIKPPCGLAPLIDPGFNVCFREPAAPARIEKAVRAMRGGGHLLQLRRDLASGAEARIDDSLMS
jgi:hypothetical protein